MNSLSGVYARFQADLNAAAARVIASGWTILGPEVDAFEEAWAAHVGSGHCVGVASGSDALQLALRALEVGSGDEVLTVANAGGYSTQAILAVGARPVFVDIHPTRYCSTRPPSAARLPHVPGPSSSPTCMAAWHPCRPFLPPAGRRASR
nr:DegT/DnrJ/EryC1/StrS family aminotransferase [Zoogloea sp.]